METDNRPIPQRAVHPGEILREELIEQHISLRAFAQLIGLTTAQLSAFVHGQSNVDEHLASLLGQHTSIPYASWLRLHDGYLLDTENIHRRSCETAVVDHNDVSVRQTNTPRQRYSTATESKDVVR